ncbi:hypothetical protein GCM10009117_23330 [Gangjinia marincola]|uniref:SHSP domain-containing protein n=1 Tax=Gangjinia marincola TaxID=578463 RepID=A0ABP3XYW2_9FLAO
MSNLVNTERNGLRRRANYSTFPSLSSWMSDILGSDINTLMTSNFNTGMTLPATNIKETDDAYMVEVAIPGMKKEDFDIEIDQNILTISNEQEFEDSEEKESYTRREFGYSSFKRSFTLPETADDEKISANYENGILAIEIPKREEAKQKPARRIDIK